MGKPSIDPVRWTPPPERTLGAPPRHVGIDVFPVPGVGPEDVVVTPDDHHVSGLEDGRTVKLSPRRGQRPMRSRHDVSHSAASR